jgi:hypothetical protein
MNKSMKRSTLTNNNWYKSMLAGNDAFFPSDYELIESSFISTSGVFQVDFANLPQTYKHLQLRIVMRDASSGPVVEKIGFNNNLSTVYDTHNLQGNGSSVISNMILNQDTIQAWRSPGSNAASNIFSCTIVDILDYTSSTKNTTTRSLYVFTGSTNEIALRSGAWRNTAAITSVKVYTGGLAIGSRLSIYGIKG